MNWIGVDVGKVHCQICEISATGEIWEARVPTQAERLKATFQPRPQARVLLESSTESEWVARILEGLGHEVVVADPNYTPNLGDDSIQELERTMISEKEGEEPKPGISFMVTVPRGVDSTEIVLTVDQLRELAEWADA